MRYRRIKWLLALLLATIVCHAQVSIDLTENTDGTWTLAAMPAYNVSMVVEYEDDLSQVIGEFTENADGTWTLAAMPAYNVSMVVEYEDDLSQVIGEFTENPDGTWTLDAMPASNVKMIVEYVDAEVSLTANSDGEGSYWATYYNEEAGYAADGNTTVYTAKLSTDKKKVVLTEVTDRTIPAGNAVVLKSTDGSITMTYDTDATGTLTDNDLKGSASAITTPENTYMLVKGASGVGFYHWTGTEIPAGKCYLTIDGNAIFSTYIPFDDDTGGSTTGIGTATATDDGEDGTFYDLTGRRVNGKSTAAGIYVKNGKKVVIK